MLKKNKFLENFQNFLSLLLCADASAPLAFVLVRTHYGGCTKPRGGKDGGGCCFASLLPEEAKKIF